MLTARLILAGCGKMGGTLLAGWLDRGVQRRHLTVVEPQPQLAAAIRERHQVAVFAGPEAIDAEVRADAVVFAVKPQVMDEVAPLYRRFAKGNTVFLSIAAGKPVRYFEERLGRTTPIVRSMPNTPAAVRRGITVACPNRGVTAEQLRLCHDLLESVGEVAWVEDESLLDAVTAVSGNGPAYVFLLVECLAAAAVEAGLPKDLAERLARVTISGAGELLRQSSDSPATLRQNVTTPGGTSAAALTVLMAPDGLQPLMTRAVAAGARRSRELAG